MLNRRLRLARFHMLSIKGRQRAACTTSLRHAIGREGEQPRIFFGDPATARITNISYAHRLSSTPHPRNSDGLRAQCQVKSDAVDLASLTPSAIRREEWAAKIRPSSGPQIATEIPKAREKADAEEDADDADDADAGTNAAAFDQLRLRNLGRRSFDFDSHVHCT